MKTFDDILKVVSKKYVYIDKTDKNDLIIRGKLGGGLYYLGDVSYRNKRADVAFDLADFVYEVLLAVRKKGKVR